MVSSTATHVLVLAHLNVMIAMINWFQVWWQFLTHWCITDDFSNKTENQQKLNRIYDYFHLFHFQFIVLNRVQQYIYTETLKISSNFNEIFMKVDSVVERRIRILNIFVITFI